MFNVSDDYFNSSASSPSLMYYQPYNRISTSYYPETYSFDNNPIISIGGQTGRIKFFSIIFKSLY
jgi:hypothetical protein